MSFERELILFLLILINSIWCINTEASGLPGGPDSCFCQLNGEIDDCLCAVESVDQLNNLKVYPRLSSLIKKNYFRYFKVNLKRKCPFWADDSQCALKDCSVATCPKDKLPDGIRNDSPSSPSSASSSNHEKSKYSANSHKNDNPEEKEQRCDEDLDQLNSLISEESRQAFEDWRQHDDASDSFCDSFDDQSADAEYVDLRLNPERYTGYKGESPHRIWNSIYNENCFRVTDDRIMYDNYAAQNREMCLEKRVFYRLISGLHTSINVHLSTHYLQPSDSVFSPSTWGPNFEEFLRRFGPHTTNGEGPRRLKNLYFAYLLVIRAITKAAPYFEVEEFYSGSSSDDKDVKNAVDDLLAIVRTFPNHFDERVMFRGDEKQAQQLKIEFRDKFRNITRIMDCVGCNKCRLWGKLQTQGVGTALKILFSGKQIGPESTVNADEKHKFQLTRSEIVSLWNVFARFSSSIKELETFRRHLG